MTAKSSSLEEKYCASRDAAPAGRGRDAGGDVPGDGLREEEHPARASRILRGHQARLHAAEQIEEGDGVGAEEGHQSAEGVGARRVWDGAIRRRERLDVRGPRGGASPSIAAAALALGSNVRVAISRGAHGGRSRFSSGRLTRLS